MYIYVQASQSARLKQWQRRCLESFTIARRRLPGSETNWCVHVGRDVPRVLSAAFAAEDTGTDPVWSRVRDTMRSGSVFLRGPQCFPFTVELTIQLSSRPWGSRIIIRNKLQKKLLNLVHERYSGVEKMKTIARKHVWWDKLDDIIIVKVQHSHECQE